MKILRALIFGIFLVLAAILPFPIPVFLQEKSPKYKIEQIDENDDDEIL